MHQPQRPDDGSFVRALFTSGGRGVFSSHFRNVGISNDRIVVFVDRTSSGHLLRGTGEGVPFALMQSGVHLADFTAGQTHFVHDYVSAYNRGFTLGVVFATGPSDGLQSLLAADGIEIIASASGTEVAVIYGRDVRIIIPVEVGVVTSILCGYTGSTLRVWRNYEPPISLAGSTVVRPKSRLTVGADAKGGKPWRGYLGEIAIYGRYEPAHTPGIEHAWKEYVSFLSGVFAAP